MKRLLLIVLVLLLGAQPVSAQDIPRDLRIIQSLCEINNSLEVHLWLGVRDEVPSEQVSAFLLLYSRDMTEALPGLELTDQQYQIMLVHTSVWWLYGTLIRHQPEWLDYAVNYYQFQRQVIYLWAGEYSIPPVACDSAWNTNYLNVPDLRGGELYSLPGYADWFPVPTKTFPWSG